MKTLKDLTLLDKFLFDETMEDAETFEAFLRILLGDEEIKLLSQAESEKEFRTAPWLKSIRVDVYSMDEDTVYNAEMQKERRDDLIKRMRYYQALIDSSLLAPGEVNYNSMKNTTIIMIMPFDLFGYGKYIYTFEGTCKEVPELKLNDGAKRIYINTRGKNVEDVTPQFVALMNFIEYNKVKEELADSNLSKVTDRVASIKANEEVGVKFMQRWEEEIILKQTAKEEGREEGRAEGREENCLENLRNLMKNLGFSVEQAMEALGIPKEDYPKYMSLL